MTGGPSAACVVWRGEKYLNMSVVDLIRGCRLMLETNSRAGALEKVLQRRDTWLILPVVICLSQRLSHACLSTSPSMVKPRMAH